MTGPRSVKPLPPKPSKGGEKPEKAAPPRKYAAPAKYRLHADAFLKGTDNQVRHRAKGEIIDHAGPPGRSMEPLTAEAWKRWREHPWKKEVFFPFAPHYPIEELQRRALSGFGAPIPRGPWMPETKEG